MWRSWKQWLKWDSGIWISYKIETCRPMLPTHLPLTLGTQGCAWEPEVEFPSAHLVRAISMSVGKNYPAPNTKSGSSTFLKSPDKLYRWVFSYAMFCLTLQAHIYILSYLRGMTLPSSLPCREKEESRKYFSFSLTLINIEENLYKMKTLLLIKSFTSYPVCLSFSIS